MGETRTPHGVVHLGSAKTVAMRLDRGRRLASQRVKQAAIDPGVLFFWEVFKAAVLGLGTYLVFHLCAFAVGLVEEKYPVRDDSLVFWKTFTTWGGALAGASLWAISTAFSIRKFIKRLRQAETELDADDGTTESRS